MGTITDRETYTINVKTKLESRKTGSLNVFKLLCVYIFLLASIKDCFVRVLTAPTYPQLDAKLFGFISVELTEH